jgi:hypothetical protein
MGVQVYGAAAVGFGLIGLVWRDFALVWQPVPPHIPKVIAQPTELISWAGVAEQPQSGPADQASRGARLLGRAR